MFQVETRLCIQCTVPVSLTASCRKKSTAWWAGLLFSLLPVGGMLVMIPTANSEEIGVRPVVKGDEADRVIAAIPDIEVDMTPNWNRRYRENMLRLKSGNLLEVARVVKGLMLREEERGLSTGERKMLHSAKQILISEIVLSQDASYEDVEARINTALA